MSELDGILEAALPIIQSKLNYTDSVFAVWFADLKLLDLKEDRAVFSTVSELRQKILSTKYKDVIRDALTEIIGFEVEPEFVFLGEKPEFPEMPAAEEPAPEDPAERQHRAEQMKDLTSDKPGTHSVLDDYTFENFVEGDSNRFALATCLAVAKFPTMYNPLFIYGNSGLGKTHLLAAIVNYIKKNSPRTRIVYKKSEDFINEMIAALAAGTISSFKEKYRTADYLLIDDIQFIAGKVAMQEEFFHTFSTLYEADKQIILTSDRPPKDIQPLEDRLRTRFESSVIAEISPPGYELRLAIIEKKCQSMGIVLSPELAEYMAERLNNNIRQVEGVLKKIHAICSIEQSTVTKEKIEDIISIVDPGNIPTSVMVDRILNAVSAHYGVRVEDLKSKKRNAEIANARHVAVYVIRNMTNMTLKNIASVFGKDHATIMASINKVETDIKTVKNAQAQIVAIMKEVKGKVPQD